jgi:hypothetical protein
MFTSELLKDLLVTIQCLKQELMDYDTEKVRAAREAYQEFLDGFYEEYRDMMVSQQYKAARDDPDIFSA